MRSSCPTVIRAERIYTGFKPTRLVEALLVHGGRVVYAGYEAEAWRLARLLGEAYGCGPVEKIVDGIVVPGFVDAHLHLGALGFEAGGLDLRGVDSLEELRRLVAEAASRLRGGWVYGRGWDQDVLGAWPTRYDLDDVSQGKPVLLMRICGHAAVANTEALRRLGLLERRMEGVDVGCDGEPTGLLYEEAAWRAYREARRSSDPLEAVQRAQEILFSNGVTAAASMDVDAWELAGLLEARRRGLLRLRVAVYASRGLAASLDEAGAARPWGDEKLRMTGVKLYADGSLGARTAYLSSPYSDDPSTRGRLLLPAQRLAEEARWARERGLHVAVHAIGDAALREVLRGYEAAGCRGCRVEHASLAPRELVDWMAGLAAAAAVQPGFLLSDHWAVERLGEERARSLYPFKTMLSRGVLIGFSSDAPVEPPSPLRSIYAAATRGWLSRLTPGEALDVETGLMLHTWAAARLIGLEDGGCLGDGCLADAAVLEEDPLDAPLDGLPDIGVRGVIVAGEPVWGRV